jgi:hypothetical protein
MTKVSLPEREKLVRVIREVRSRWRWKVVLRSLSVLAGAGIATVLLAALGLERFRFTPAAIVVARALTYLVLVALGWVFFVRPLARRVTDQQVALYLEEHEPSLQELLVSAVDVGGPTHPIERSGESADLLRRVIDDAVDRCAKGDLGRELERQSLRRSMAVIGGIAVVAAVILGAGPAYLRHGAFTLLVPVGDIEAASPYRIDVKPGNATIARGSDVTISAQIGGFTAAQVDLFTRTTASGPFDRAPLIGLPDGSRFEGTLFAVREDTEYFVQSAGVRSPVFRLQAAELPFVDRLDLEYVFPPYTGLPPRKVEKGGDIAALRGTIVRLLVHSSVPADKGRVVIGEGSSLPLTANPDGTLGGALDVRDDGVYRIDLATPSGAMIAASPQYTIDVLADEPPTVSFAKPGRDLRATSIDEVFVEASADDDFGIGKLGLVYSINGGPEKTVSLAGGGRTLKEVTAGYTFFLEELGLKPGDVVSYYARATDNDMVQGAKSVTSDIYFVQIQPFRKDYRAAESQAGGESQGGRGGGAGDTSALSEQQRRIVAGTFNVVRDRDKVGAEKFRQDVVFLALTQGQLRERAQTLAAQIPVRVGGVDPTMNVVAASLAEASTAMAAAETRLQARDATNALPPEQQALASLQRAEEAYRDVRIRMEQQRGGGGQGGGGQQSAAAEELADLFQLEMDKLRNQYETFQRSQQQSADNQVDAVLERLRELARRQEQEAERQRAMAGNRQNTGGASGARQRQLAEETEEAARQLERLSREDRRPELGETARRMREAAGAMRRAAASGDATAFAEAQAAADRLSQARDRLDRQRTDRMTRDIQDALSRVDRLAEQQKGIEAGVRSLDRAGPERGTQVQQLIDRKDAQAREVGDIEKQLDRTAADFQRERRAASQAVRGAADAIRDNKLKEKINYSKGLVQGAPPDTAAGFEEQIASDIASVADRLRKAAGAAGAPERDRRAEALGRARELLRGVQSMDDRQRGQQARGAPERGQSGSQGDQGARADLRGGASGEGPRGDTAGQSLDRPAGGGGNPRGAAPGARDARPTANARQFQREVRERQVQAEALRRDLQALGVNPAELDAILRDMRALDAAGTSSDPGELARIQARLVEGVRRFEFNLRRELGDATAEPLLLSGSDQTPAAYRKLVEAYYRALAQERKK